MVRRKRAAAAALMLLAVLGASGVAIADDDDGGRPRTDSVEAAIVFTHFKERHRFCEGQDGFYVEANVVVDGTSTGDPRLTGDVQLRLYILFNIATELGREQGTFVVRDPVTHKKKVTGDFFNADREEISQGVIVGKVHERGSGEDDDSPEGGHLIANWRITFNEDFSITAQVGGIAPDGRLPAVVQSGHCTGPFEKVEVDIPPPGGATAARSASESVRWGSRTP